MTLAAEERKLAQGKLLAPWTFISAPPSGPSFEEYQLKHALQVSFLIVQIFILPSAKKL